MTLPLNAAMTSEITHLLSWWATGLDYRSMTAHWQREHPGNPAIQSVTRSCEKHGPPQDPVHLTSTPRQHHRLIAPRQRRRITLCGTSGKALATCPPLLVAHMRQASVHCRRKGGIATLTHPGPSFYSLRLLSLLGVSRVSPCRFFYRACLICLFPCPVFVSFTCLFCVL